ncbi:hypothetical protein ACFPK5_01745 [Streptomyces beijiangensis]|uniref:hypothetical protein n=1 Tax=Streptomyces beijiangensis TaxID=163361 RepID=UPI003623D363
MHRHPARRPARGQRPDLRARAGRPADRPLLIGSHKANFGHTDSAAGILGLLKAMLVARHGVVPPQINVAQPMDLVTRRKQGYASRPHRRRFPVTAPAMSG